MFLLIDLLHTSLQLHQHADTLNDLARPTDRLLSLAAGVPHLSPLLVSAERAQQLRLKLEYNLGKLYFDQAESLLQEYKAKDAQTNYRQAKKQFEHILANVDPDHGESRQHLPKIEERLEMLDLAVEAAEHDLEIALRQIEDYQYMLAAQRLTTETDERKYAFDLKPDLKKQYEETIQKNQDVLKIVEELFPGMNTIK